MTAKLETGEDSYNPDVEDAKKLTRLTLRSTPVDLASSFAIASIRCPASGQATARCCTLCTGHHAGFSAPSLQGWQAAADASR